MTVQDYDFEEAMSDVTNIEYSESEGADHRVDFSGGYSLWLRDGRCVEGIAPWRLRTKLNKLCADLSVTNYIQYQ